jgi:hypothetical protein
MTDFERLYNCSSLIEREAKEAKKVRHVEMDAVEGTGS